MKIFSNSKTIIGGLFLTMIGSALWENVFRDVFNFIGRTLLTVSTLGVEKYKDDIYVDIAKGFYEQASIQVLSFVIGILAGVIVAMVGAILKNKKEDENNKNSKIINWLKEHRRFVKLTFLFYSFFVIGITVLGLSKITYINKSIAYYKQLETIASPYLTVDQEKVFNSKFSQIKNRDDYIKIIKDLELILKDKVQTLPESPSFIF